LHPDLIAKLVILLSIANGTPVLLNKVLHGRFAHPIDAGLRFVDGRRLFGPSKNRSRRCRLRHLDGCGGTVART
jgi:CDP-2,3-bis-(O-geranylgeranyl)-sn-glycerol synthase